MENVTPLQAIELANCYLGLSQAISHYRHSNWDELSFDENKQLSNAQWMVLNAAEELALFSKNILSSDLHTAILQIKSITYDIQGTVKMHKNVQKLINVSTAAVTLASAVISSNAKETLTYIGVLTKVWSS